MKIWLRGKWYALPNELLVIYLKDKDKKNIANMNKDCKIYAEYDKETFDTQRVIKLLKKLRADGDVLNA